MKACFISTPGLKSLNRLELRTCTPPLHRRCFSRQNLPEQPETLRLDTKHVQPKGRIVRTLLVANIHEGFAYEEEKDKQKLLRLWLYWKQVVILYIEHLPRNPKTLNTYHMEDPRFGLSGIVGRKGADSFSTASRRQAHQHGFCICLKFVCVTLYVEEYPHKKSNSVQTVEAEDVDTS